MAAHVFEPMAGDDVCLWFDIDDPNGDRCFGFEDDPRHIPDPEEDHPHAQS